MRTSAGVAAIFLVAALAAAAEVTLEPTATDCGGGRSSAGAVAMDSHIGSVAGVPVGGDASARIGYAGQLAEVVGFVAAAVPPEVGEGGTRQASAMHLLDDGSVAAMRSHLAAWSIVSGPVVGVDTNGLVTAGVVWTSAPAQVRAVWMGMTGTVALVVLDADPDNYGLYAGDGAADSWQVGFFGIGNPDGIGSADPDKDSAPNRDEYGSDTCPTNGSSFLRLTSVSREGPSTVRIGWAGGVHAAQAVMRCDGGVLATGSWTCVYWVQAPTAVATNWVDSGATNRRVFYCIRAQR